MFIFSENKKILTSKTPVMGLPLICAYRKFKIA